MDPAINLLQKMSEMARSDQDKALATPEQDPSSPFMSPPSTSNSLCIVNSNQQPMRTEERLRKLSLKSQDADHRRRFERYLNDCGVKRELMNVIRTTEEINSIVHNLLDNDEDGGSVYEETNLPNEEHEDFDLFYCYHGDYWRTSNEKEKPDEDIDVLGNDDSEFSYVKTDYPTNNKRVKITLPPHLPMNLQDAFLFWENHDKDDFEVGQTSVRFSDEPQWAVKRQPATKFADSLDLNFYGLVKLEYDYGKKYKNNLAAFSNIHQVLFTGTNSEIFAYELDIDNKPSKRPILRFDTKPSAITERDRNSSTWPYFPFTINFMKIDYFLNKEVLAVTCDDGRVLIWFVELLMKQVPLFAKLGEERIFSNGIYGIRIHPDFQLRVECSAWSVDFYNKLNMIAVSDNSQSVSLFYLEKSQAKFYAATSHQVLHNIPDVSFIKGGDDEVMDNRLKVQISCASIRGELIIFEFIIYKVYGPFLNDAANCGPITVDTDEDSVTASNTVDRVIFDTPKVKSRTLLSEDVWTTNFVDGMYFKKVNSLKNMTGDPNIDEDLVISNIILQSEKMDGESDPCLSSDLGLAAKFQFFQIPTELLHIHNNQPITSEDFITVSDRYRRIRKMFDSYYFHKKRSKQKTHKSLNGKSYWEPIVRTENNNKFLCVTSSEKFGLFNTDRLLCLSSTPTSVFDFNLSFEEEASYSNRLSISCVIPELSCVVIGSQVGLVSIFRLCTFRGCYGMRQEYIFPNASRLALGDRGYRTITGLCVRKVGGVEDRCLLKFVIYITYIDGLVLCYGLSEKDNGLEISDI